MCLICKTIKTMDIKNALVELGAAMTDAESPRQLDHLNGVLDRLMGMETTEQNAEMDEAWELSHR